MIMNFERCGNGEKLIFIHGSGMSGKMWYEQKKDLEEYFDLIFVDLPGHGKTPDYNCKSVEDYRDSLYETIKAKSLDPCYLAGHSLGGAITISFALAYPNLLKGITLIGTGAKLRVLPKILNEIKGNKSEIVEYIINLSFADKASAELKDYFKKLMLECDADVIFRDFNSCDRFNVMDMVELIKIKTLILCGNEDLLTPPKYSNYLNNKIKGSKLSIIEGAGHMVMVEQPKQVNGEIKKFVLNKE